MAPVPSSVLLGSSAAYSGSLLTLIVLIIDLMSIIQVLKSNRTAISKLLWCLLIFLFPIFGVLIYLIAERREKHKYVVIQN